MADVEKESQAQQDQAQLEGGTYEIIRNRLAAQAKDLQDRVNKLNAVRKDTFGSIDLQVLDRARITTEHNCIARDMVPVGTRFIFGYNVHFGLKSTTELKDVFAVYEYRERQFHTADLSLIDDKRFEEDFNNLYKYYKETTFSRFAIIGPHLFMVFQVGKRPTDIKTFKWAIQGDGLTYLDNRSDHEFKYPPQHEFTWKRTHRDLHREGKHPHISIEDRVFVETVGGDLTIKVEDNTESGEGIYREPVENADQVLDDAEISYAVVGPLILLKIKPYQEKDHRYIIYNDKIKEARRVDAIQHSCVLLPDDHGIIFSSGYYLVNGEHKQFEHGLKEMLFERRVPSANGEDHLFVFHNRASGVYILLSYNMIEQRVATPIVGQGYSIFENGEMVYFGDQIEPQKHHPVQVWQTPYVGPNFELPQKGDSRLYKIGNKEVVRAMAECWEVIKLCRRETPYESLYLDLVKNTTDITDSYFWVGEGELFNLKEVLEQIRRSAGTAIDEFEKVTALRKQTETKVRETTKKAEEILGSLRGRQWPAVDGYVAGLNELRLLRGEVISLKDLRYVDLPHVEALEKQVAEQSDGVSEKTVEFLLQPNALDIYEEKVAEEKAAIPKLTKVTEAREHEEAIHEISGQLELLIEIVGNLKIDDSTKTTQIIDAISAIFQKVNQVRAALTNKKKELGSAEAVAEFGSQIKLVSQSVVNFMDLCDTPEKCDEYLTKLLVQVEELEGKFADYDEFVTELSTKREEIYQAFESKKTSLMEARQKRAVTLQGAADRILKGVENRARGMKSVDEINSYFATDLMIDKVRDTIEKLRDLGDSVKSDEIQSRLKTIKEDALRQLKDKLELYADGGDVIQFGKQKFSVNTQPLDLSTVIRDGKIYYHITGTNFYEMASDPELDETRAVWAQEIVSENNNVYRAEYLAYQFLKASESGAQPPVAELAVMEDAALLDAVQKFASPRYAEGYVKGVHDGDAAKIVRALAQMNQAVGLLRYPTASRACAQMWFRRFGDGELKGRLAQQLRGVRAILRVLPHRLDRGRFLAPLEEQLVAFAETTALFPAEAAREGAEYLYFELTAGEDFVIAPEAAKLFEGFTAHLKKANGAKAFEETLAGAEADPVGTFALVRAWLAGYLEKAKEAETLRPYLDEAAVLCFTGSFEKRRVLSASITRELEGMLGSHSRIAEGRYGLSYPEFMSRLAHYDRTVGPMFRTFQEAKKRSAERFREQLRLEEFKPRILSSFVRNKLLDQVYLPLIGDNLAKQMGTVGANTRTDRMGMLLLISPPGYGKTTLMEYIANRLGIIFMKINGPAIGHHVTSLDPVEAPNATARQELEKLNLSLEMGDNVMIYLDDIQHCNPEFLQKFISLCDAQRKIEGVYKGRTKTYDLRGRKVCVIMAGNPYTESGEKFQIPDMLANRADTYNLGDIIGDTRAAFELSYIENAMTSNASLARLSAKSHKDLHGILRIAETGSREGVDFEANHSATEISEYVDVLKKLMAVRDVILRINEMYIESAAQADEFRTQPPFKLQGSYRNMNKLAEKVLPVMNDAELKTLIFSHYDQEAQTLTTGAEANLLNFKLTFGFEQPGDRERWAEICDTFRRNQKFRGIGGGQADSMTQIMGVLNDLSEGVGGLNAGIAGGLTQLADRVEQSRPTGPQEVRATLEGESLGPVREALAELKLALDAMRQAQSESDRPVRAEFAPEALAGLQTGLADLKAALAEAASTRSEAPQAAAPAPISGDLRATFPPESLAQLHEILTSLAMAVIPERAPASAPTPPAPSENKFVWSPKEGEFNQAGSLRRFLEGSGFIVREVSRTEYLLERDGGLPVRLRIEGERFYLEAEVGALNGAAGPDLYRVLLDFNSEILPVSFALREDTLLLVESREGASLTRNELSAIIAALDGAHRKATGLLAQVGGGGG
ncbi:MAG: DNA repair ATPase [Sumerlaeia bacterium]